MKVGGVNEFLFQASLGPLPTDTVTPQGSNGYVGTPTNNPTPLGPSTSVGPSSTFQFGTAKLQWSLEFQKGPWPSYPNGFAYLGVEFYIGPVNPSDLHYGYIGLSACTPDLVGTTCSVPDPSVIQIQDFAYNTVAGQPILTPTPEPSTLPLLALGAAGLAAFRARRKKTA